MAADTRLGPLGNYLPVGHNREKSRISNNDGEKRSTDDSHVKWFLTQLGVRLENEAVWHALATVGIGSTYQHLFLTCVQLVELAF